MILNCQIHGTPLPSRRRLAALNLEEPVALDFGARAQDFLKRITPLSADLAAGCDEYPAVRPVAISLLGKRLLRQIPGRRKAKKILR
jgi:hypothetical protein